MSMSAIKATITNGSGSGGVWTTPQVQASDNSLQPMTIPYNELVLLGYMHKYDIPKDYYEQVKGFVAEKVGRIMLDSNGNHGHYSASGLMIDVCEKHLSNFKFNDDLKTILDGSNV